MTSSSMSTTRRIPSMVDWDPIEESEELELVTIHIDGLIPCKSTKKIPEESSDISSPKKRQSSKDAANGTVEVTFLNQGIDLTAKFKENGKDVECRYEARRLPSPIEPDECHWKIEKEKVVITIVKKKVEVLGEKGLQYVNWMPLCHKNGLDQYDSSEDEDGNLPDRRDYIPMAERVPWEVEKGVDNVFVLPPGGQHDLTQNFTSPT